MKAHRLRFGSDISRRAGLFGGFLLLAVAVASLSYQARPSEADSAHDQPRYDLPVVDEDYQAELQGLISDDRARVEIAVRPTGDRVVSISPTSEGIIIRGPELRQELSPAPLLPDHPEKGDPALDTGAQRVRDALNGGRNVVVLSRPSATTDDSTARRKEWDAWQGTYLELLASGQSFIECEITLDAEIEQCWIIEPPPAPADQPEPIYELADQPQQAVP